MLVYASSAPRRGASLWHSYRPTALGLIGAVAALACCLGAPSIAAAQTGCTTSDPWTASAAQLEACHMHAYPETSTRTLASGATEYAYNENGHTVADVMPPASFDPATATTAQLEEYGFRLPSTTSPGYEVMEKALHETVGFHVPPPEMVTGDLENTIKSENWSGYVDTGGKGGYTESQTSWHEPADGTTECSNSEVSMWTGIGDTYLAQDGSEQGYSPWPENELWFEIVPDGEGAQATGMAGSPSYLNIALTYYKGSDKYEFMIYTEYTKEWTGPWYAEEPFAGDVAESIVERPTVGGSLTNLLNYNYVKMTGFTNSGDIGEHPYEPYDMYSNGYKKEIAEVGSLGGVGLETFKDTHIKCD